MEKIKKLSKYRTIILVLLDIACIVIAYYLGMVLVSESSVYKISGYYMDKFSKTIILSIIVYQLVFHLSKSYKSIIRYEEGKDYLKYFGLCIISSIIICIIRKVFKFYILFEHIDYMW